MHVCLTDAVNDWRYRTPSQLKMITAFELRRMAIGEPNHLVASGVRLACAPYRGVGSAANMRLDSAAIKHFIKAVRIGQSSTPEDVKEYMQKRGLEAWHSYLSIHLDIKSVDQLKAVTAVDLRRMGIMANMKLVRTPRYLGDAFGVWHICLTRGVCQDVKTIDQVLAAIKRST